MLIAGLTGGIATGKSTVSQIFKKAGAIIIDADLLARKLVGPGSKAFGTIKSVFGPQVVRPDGSLDRSLLGEMVFSDERLRDKLEGIIHPLVRSQMDREVSDIMARAPKALVIKDIPLLLEAGMTNGLAEIIVVYAPVELQLKRLMERDGMGADAARARINAQMPIEEKCRRGTLVIDNSGDLSHTESKVLSIYKELAQRARQES